MAIRVLSTFWWIVPSTWEVLAWADMVLGLGFFVCVLDGREQSGTVSDSRNSNTGGFSS